MTGRSIADVLRVGHVVATLVALVVDPLPGVLLGSAVVAVAVRPLRLPGPFDVAAVTAMIIAGWSSGAGLYDTFGFYDRLVHFTVLGLLAAPALVLLERLGVAAPGATRHPRVAFVVLATCLALAIGALWEVFEYASDRWAGTTLAHGYVDTVGDLVADGLGGAAGSALLYLVWEPDRRGQAVPR